MAGADANVPSDILSPVFVYDNEPRNKQITDRIEKHISAGDSVCYIPLIFEGERHQRYGFLLGMMFRG